MSVNEQQQKLKQQLFAYTPAHGFDPSSFSKVSADCRRRSTRETNRIGAPETKDDFIETCAGGASIGIDLIRESFNVAEEGDFTREGLAQMHRQGAITGIEQTAKKCEKLIRGATEHIGERTNTDVPCTTQNALRKICQQGVIAGIKLQKTLE